MKKHGILCALLCIVLVLSGLPFSSAAAAKAMTLHVIRLGETAKDYSANQMGNGDAVLLESKGKYLLMDTGIPSRYKNVKAYLDKLGIKKLDIYISHIHIDHYGNLETLSQDYTIGRIYFPNKMYGKEAPLHSWFYNTLLPRIKKNSGAKITFLKTGSSFTFGDANVKIIGPVGTYTYKQFKNSTTKDAKLNDCINNYSLSAMITCGKTKYFTAGDIQEEEENALLKKYGKSGLKADIMKLNHHGITTSNKEKFMAAVAPAVSFITNEGHPAMMPNETLGKDFRRSFATRVEANKYGICLSPGDEKKNIIIKVSNDKISTYRGTVKKANLLTGWVEVQGGDGVHRKTDKFYIDAKTGKALTGIQTLSKKMYDFGTGGCMEYGRFSDKGKYQYIKYYDNMDYRYYKKDGSIRTGFYFLKKSVTGQQADRLVYFDPKTGFVVRSQLTEGYEMFTIKSKKYMINDSGTIYKGWKSEGDNSRYFDPETGAMTTGWLDYVSKSDGNTYTYYLDEETGLRLKGFQKIGEWVYYFNPISGNLKRTPGKMPVGDNVYRCDTDGRVRQEINKELFFITEVPEGA